MQLAVGILRKNSLGQKEPMYLSGPGVVLCVCKSPHLSGIDIACFTEAIVLHQELARGQRLTGASHRLWEQLLDLFDCPDIESTLLGLLASLWGRISILCTVEASGLWG